MELGNALDKASQMLAGGENTAAKKTPPAKPKFVHGETIDPPDKVVGSARVANQKSAHDSAPIVEFLHFGNVHPTYSSRFPHGKLTDDKALPPSEFPETAKPRGIQFKAALERETILLSLFIQSTKEVMVARDKDKGALGGALSTVGNLLGASGGGSGGSQPADLEPFVDQVKAVADKLNVAAIHYKNIFQAGEDLHQARADYRAYLDKLMVEKPDAGGGGLMSGVMSAVTGGASGLGGTLGGILATAQGIAFKPQQIRMRFFAQLAAQQELQIEKACHGMTLAALKSEDQRSPFFPVWFIAEPAKDPVPEKTPDEPKHYDDNLKGKAEKAIDEAKAKVDKAKKDVGDTVKDIQDFFAPPDVPKPPPGTPFLSLAFAPPDPTAKPDAPSPMEMGNLACNSFREALEMKSLGSLVETIVKTIVGITFDLVHAAMQTCLARDSKKSIVAQDLYDGARQRIYQKLLALAMDNLSFINKAKQIHTPSVNNQSFAAGGLIDKGIDKMKEMVDDKLGQFLDIPLKLAMSDFADQMEEARKQGETAMGHTMECYLGRLPWMQSTLFFHLFFPFWDMVMDLLGSVMGPALSGPLGAIGKAAGKAKELTDTARDLKAKADLAKKKLDDANAALKDGMNQNQMAAAAMHLGQDKADIDNKNADVINAPPKPEAAGEIIFPFTMRFINGTGQEIPKPDLDALEDKWKWKEAHQPAKEEDKPAAATP